MRLALALLSIVFLALAQAARAHDPGLSSARLTWGADRVESRLELHDDDLRGVDLLSIAPRSLILESEAGPIEPLAVEVAPTRERHTGIRLVHPVEAGVELAARLALLEELSFGHKTYLRVEAPDGATLAERILSAGATPVAIGRAGAARVRTPLQFLALGIEHILVGFDHLLFLLVVLLGCASLGAAIRVVTAFTLAHSITLAAASVGWLRLPAGVVEPVIAASIVYVAGLALLARGRSQEGRGVAFAFGLVHGLGFASVLTGMGVGAGGTIVPLLSFNLGVELGQLGITALVLPGLLYLRRTAAFARIAVPACAGLAGAVGLFWLAERTLGA